MVNLEWSVLWRQAVKIAVESVALKYCRKVTLPPSLPSPGIHRWVDASRPADEVFNKITTIFESAKSKDLVMFI